MALTGTVTDRPRLLALRALGLGDALTGIPALRALAAAVPDLRLTVAMPASLAPVLPLAGLPADVLPTNGLSDTPPAGPVPLAVNLHGRGPQSHAWLQSARPDRLVAFASGDVPGPSWRAEEHERDRWCRLLREGLGIDADPLDLRLEVAHRPGGDTALVHPGAASGARRWPVERYAALATRLRQQGLRVLVTGSRVERSLALDLASRAGLSPSVVLAGATTITELTRQVADAAVLVSGDTGVAHLAAATGTPSVTLFGPVPPAEWGPPPGPHIGLWAGRRGDPHADEPDPGLLALSVDDVVDAVGQLASEALSRTMLPRMPLTNAGDSSVESSRTKPSASETATASGTSST